MIWSGNALHSTQPQQPQPPPLPAEERDWVERLGDWSMASARKAFANAGMTIAIGTVVLFAIARIPTQIYYAQLGVRPEDVGFNSVQVLLQGTTTVLLISVGAALIYGVGLPLFSVLYWQSAKRFLPDSSPERLRRSRVGRLLLRLLPGIRSNKTGIRRILRLGPVVIPLLAVGVALLLLTSRALHDPDLIRDGVQPEPAMTPWRADRVEVRWAQETGSFDLPSCRWLFYLGEDDGRVVLFDAKLDNTYRIASDAVELEFPGTCS
jgi:hypothetical protein